MDNSSSVLSKLNNEEIGNVFFTKSSDILDFISKPFDLRGQNIIFSLKNILEQNKTEIVYLLTHELGKPISQCEEEIKKSLDILNNYEKIEVSTSQNQNILILGSMSAPVYEFASSLSTYINSYSKFIYKPSSKAATTMSFVYTKMSEELGLTERVIIAPMTKHTIEETLEKVNFAKVVKYSRGNLENTENIQEIEDLSQKDKIIFIDTNSDLDFGVGRLIDNLFDYEKFNTSRIQHVFIEKTVVETFSAKLISKCELVLNAGRADNPNVNFSDTFKAYKRQDLKETLLELVSMGADILYGSIEEVMTSPIIVKCSEDMEEYYKKDFWAPVIFLIVFEDEADVPMLAVPFAQSHKAISLLNKENFEKIKNSSDMEVEDFQNNV